MDRTAARPLAFLAASLIALGLMSLGCSTSDVKPSPYGDCTAASGCDQVTRPPSASPIVDAGRAETSTTVDAGAPDTGQGSTDASGD